MQIRDSANNSWRDLENPAQPSLGAHDPLKSDIRGTMGVVEDATINGSVSGSLQQQINSANTEIDILKFNAGTPGLNFDTLAELDAYSPSPAPAVGTIAFVNLDPVPSNNRKYIYKPGVTGGPWIATNDRVDVETARAEGAESNLGARLSNIEAPFGQYQLAASWPAGNSRHYVGEATNYWREFAVALDAGGSQLPVGTIMGRIDVPMQISEEAETLYLKIWQRSLESPNVNSYPGQSDDVLLETVSLSASASNISPSTGYGGGGVVSFFPTTKPVVQEGYSYVFDVYALQDDGVSYARVGFFLKTVAQSVQRYIGWYIASTVTGTWTNDSSGDYGPGVYVYALDIPALDFGFCSDISQVAPAPQFFNGAVALAGPDGRNFGFKIPAGQTGQTTLQQIKLPCSGLGPQLANRTVKAKFGCTTSENYALPFSALIFQATQPTSPETVNLPTTIIQNTQISATRRIIEMSAELTGSETTLQPFFSVGNTEAVEADTTLLVTDVLFEIIASPSDVFTLTQENLLLSQDFQQSDGGSGSGALTGSAIAIPSWQVTVTVKPDGSGDFETPWDAVASINDASASKRYRILIYPGTYISPGDWQNQDYVDLVGTDRGSCIIHYELPDDVDPTTIQNHQGMWVNGTTALINLTITGKNCRYPVHSDSVGTITNGTILIVNCHLEHQGNQGAYDYQVSLGTGGDPGAVWTSTSPFGYGASSGQMVVIRNSTLKGPFVGLYIHTNANFDRPCVLDVEDCNLVATTDGCDAILVTPLGSGSNDLVRVVGCSLVGDIGYECDPWAQTTLDGQPSNHAKIKLFGHDNTATPFIRSHDESRALQIASASTGSSSSVAISGTAASVLFGSTPITDVGDVGFSGAVIGSVDVAERAVGLSSNIYITAMGLRLGDCSSVSKTLAVVVDGGSPIDIVFNTDMTAVSNATILATINSALSSAATASLISLTAQYRPAFDDEEQMLINSSGSGIPFGSVLAYDTSQAIPMKYVRLMTSSDSASLFAGVAWENIYPDQTGRVKNKGYLAIGDILRTDSASFAFGDTFSIDAGHPGEIYKGGSQGLLTAIRSDAVCVRQK